jgi:hypothetical protein
MGSSSGLDPFTSEPQSGRVLNVFFLVLGTISRLTGLGLPVVYHGARLASGWLLLLSVYCLGARVLATIFARRLALLTAALASGLGWAFHAVPGQPHPIDFGPGLVMPEAIVSLSLLLNPLFCFSMFLMVAILGFAADAFQRDSTRSAVMAGLAALVLGNIHTYDLLPVTATVVAYVLLLLTTRQARLGAVAKAAGIIVLIAAPSLAYQVWLLRLGDITLTIKTAETPVYSPAPMLLALGIGLPLALSVFGLARLLRPGAPPFARLLALWLVLGFVMVYAPLPFQRKLAQGISIPAVLLAVYGMEPLLTRIKRAHAVALAAAFLAVMLPSNMLFVGRTLGDLRTNNADYLANLMPPLYLRGDQHVALQWLESEADFQDVLLCNSFLGSYAPGLAGTRVYLGHWAETIHFREKLAAYARFLRADTDEAERPDLIREHGITYVLRDESIYDELFHLSPDGAVLPAFDPGQAAWLQPVYAKGSVTVYRVIAP